MGCEILACETGHLLNQIGHMKKPFGQKSVFMKNLQLYFGTIIFYSNNLNYEILKIILKKTIERHTAITF